jgi:phosphohistidine phosphatase SixA
MSSLFLMRHAHAGDPERWTGDDGLRPLTDKGRR